MNAASSDWNPDPALVSHVEDSYRRAMGSYRANPNLVREHVNLEESIRVGGYANRTLTELVQNAADALVGNLSAEFSGSGRIEVVLDEKTGTLYCANAGRPFSADGLTTLLHAYLSSKRGDEIGRFGLGFKSVLAVSDKPEVFSRSISVAFKSEQAEREMRTISPSAKRVPVLRTATPIDANGQLAIDPVLQELTEWASTVVRLPNLRDVDRLSEEIRNFATEFLLFATAVREIRLRIIGSNGYETTHRSHPIGDDWYAIQTPEGASSEWLLLDAMHQPSLEAQKEVGEAISRDRIKVAVAMPRDPNPRFLGRFWSYFSLDDKTSAKAYFNAPWALNDDRTTILSNAYNDEILRTVSEMFVNALPRVAVSDDPGKHLDYLPARARETYSHGDTVIRSRVPALAANLPLIPDADENLVFCRDLKPLNLNIVFPSPEDGVRLDEIHRLWQSSANTGSNVPHWSAYKGRDRPVRLREMFISSYSNGDPDISDSAARSLINSSPNRSLAAWMREWANGPELRGAADALVLAAKYVNVYDELESVRIIPTNQGPRSLADRKSVFLEAEEGVEIGDAPFVVPNFLALRTAREVLEQWHFRVLDPVTRVEARLSQLTADAVGEQQDAAWQALRTLPPHDATGAAKRRGGMLRVPTRDGDWRWPGQVIDLRIEAGEYDRPFLLDNSRCIPEVAHALGTSYRPTADFALSDEPLVEEYRSAVLELINSERGPGERSTELIDFNREVGPGPVSGLEILQRSGAPDQMRIQWTIALLALPDPEWVAEDLDTRKTYSVPSPLKWAVQRAGLVQSAWGPRAPRDVVAPSLLRYRGFLPLLHGEKTPVAEKLALPKELEDVRPEILHEGLSQDLYPSKVDDGVLEEFIVAACTRSHEGQGPDRLPSRNGRVIESVPASSVYLATSGEEAEFLNSKGKFFLHVSPDAAQLIAMAAGARRFAEVFSFSTIVEGALEGEAVLDVFTGLRNSPVARRIGSASIVRALHIVKRVTTPDGVEDQSLPWIVQDGDLFVGRNLDDLGVLTALNEAFELGLSNFGLQEVLQAGINEQLEELRLEALAATSDEERLETYFGDDDLRDRLPTDLWEALENQGLVDRQSSVSELYLKVYGTDSIKLLRDAFRDKGFSDVPQKWTSGGSTVGWLRKMGFGPEYAARSAQQQQRQFTVPGAVVLGELHDYQLDIRQKLRDVLTLIEPGGGHLKAMVELPTGSGKTRVASQTVLELFIQGKLRGPVLWIAESQELCEQAVQTWSYVWRGLGDIRPLTIGRLWEGNEVDEPDTEFSVIVATDAMLAVAKDNPTYEWLSEPGAVIIDEAHRAGASERYTALLDWLGVAGRGWARPLIGLSATPFKGGENSTGVLARRFGSRRLAAFTGDDVYKQAADKGVLARVKHEVLTGIDVDLHLSEVEEVNKFRRVSHSVLDRIGKDQRRLSMVAEHISSLDPSWPVLVFTPSVLSAQVLAAMLRYRDISAAAVSGQTGRQERRDTIRDFTNGKIRVLTNCDLLTQGFDAPGVRALYIARPTFSPSAYIQMAGRGLRGPLNGGKEECLIVDIADNFGALNEFLGYRDYEKLWLEQK